MKIVYKNIDDLIPYALNQKEHPQKQINQIASSLKEFGFKQPIVIDKDNQIIVGHGRYEGAKKINLNEVPCLIADDLTDTQIKAYRIADNKLNESEWNEDLLRLELENLKELNFDFSEIMEFNFDEDFSQDEEFEVNLPSGDREPIRNMTFTVSDEQHELIEEVLKLAKEYPLQDPAGINENSNGNALYYICEVFKNGLDS